MARQLRIEYPGAFYHVTSRGNQKNPIFLESQDRAALLDYIGEAFAKFGSVIHAFCLMDSHYHLLLETPRGNLSKIMHFINTSYSVFFNKRHSRAGHFFQGRYKAILIEKDAYALELSRYIHLNPVRAGIVARPEEYPYSSYRGYIGLRQTEDWLVKAFVLGYFGNDREKARAKYTAFVCEAIGQTCESPLVKCARSLILGSEVFIARIKKSYVNNKTQIKDIPAIRALKEKPSLEKIHRSVEQTLGTKNRLIRNAAIFLCRKRTDYSLKEVAEFYLIGKSAVGKIYGQMKELLVRNKTLDDTLKEIEKSLFG